MSQVIRFLDSYFNVSLADISVIDILEILIIAFMIYEIMIWVKNTKAWVLMKGFVVLAVFIALAAVLQMNTILFIADKVFSIGMIALVIIFQPELRKALEQIGQSNMISKIINSPSGKKKMSTLSQKDIDEVVRAVYEMGKARTGALIVFEREISLNEYIATGIDIDAVISSQLLLNIFEHNTPLHDGAAIVRGNRIVSATCYLPLSESLKISKALGTRHRAGVGISEVTDSMTVIVSEETGFVSVAMEGKLIRHLNAEGLTELFMKYFPADDTDNQGRKGIFKGKGKTDERQVD